MSKRQILKLSGIPIAEYDDSIHSKDRGFSFTNITNFIPYSDFVYHIIKLTGENTITYKNIIGISYANIFPVNNLLKLRIKVGKHSKVYYFILYSSGLLTILNKNVQGQYVINNNEYYLSNIVRKEDDNFEVHKIENFMYKDEVLFTYYDFGNEGNSPVTTYNVKSIGDKLYTAIGNRTDIEKIVFTSKANMDYFYIYFSNGDTLCVDYNLLCISARKKISKSTKTLKIKTAANTMYDNSTASQVNHFMYNGYTIVKYKGHFKVLTSKSKDEKVRLAFGNVDLYNKSIYNLVKNKLVDENNRIDYHKIYEATIGILKENKDTNLIYRVKLYTKQTLNTMFYIGIDNNMYDANLNIVGKILPDEQCNNAVAVNTAIAALNECTKDSKIIDTDIKDIETINADTEDKNIKLEVVDNVVTLNQHVLFDYTENSSNEYGEIYLGINTLNTGIVQAIVDFYKIKNKEFTTCIGANIKCEDGKYIVTVVLLNDCKTYKALFEIRNNNDLVIYNCDDNLNGKIIDISQGCTNVNNNSVVTFKDIENILKDTKESIKEYIDDKIQNVKDKTVTLPFKNICIKNNSVNFKTQNSSVSGKLFSYTKKDWEWNENNVTYTFTGITEINKAFTDLYFRNENILNNIKNITLTIFTLTASQYTNEIMLGINYQDGVCEIGYPFNIKENYIEYNCTKEKVSLSNDMYTLKQKNIITLQEKSKDELLKDNEQSMKRDITEDKLNLLLNLKRINLMKNNTHVIADSILNKENDLDKALLKECMEDLDGEIK